MRPFSIPRSPRAWLLVSWAIGLALIAAAIGLALRAAEPPVSLILSHPVVPSMALLHIADRKGFFVDEGLEVTLDRQLVGRDAIRLLLEGKADLAVAYETPTVLRACQGGALRIHSVVHSSSRATGVVARHDRGIMEAEHLRGKRVGLPSLSNAQQALSSVLRSAGIPKDDVTVVDIPPRRIAEALGNGEVDAVSIWHPRIDDAREWAGRDATSVFFSDVYTEHSLLLSRDGSALPTATIERVLRALRRAEEFAGARPEESIALLQDAFPENRETIRETWKDFTFGIGLNRVLQDSLEHTIDWAQGDGMTTCDALQDSTSIIDPEALRNVDPTLVTIF